MARNGRDSVCDYWNSVCPKDEDCPKLHGNVAKSFVCKQLLAKGHCMMFGRCNMAHPKPVSLANSNIMQDLVAEESMVIDVRDIYDSTQTMDDNKSKKIRFMPVVTSLSSFGWTKGATNEIIVPGEIC